MPTEKYVFPDCVKYSHLSALRYKRISGYDFKIVSLTGHNIHDRG